MLTKGVWCSGITFDLHSKGLGFDPRYIQLIFFSQSNNYIFFKIYYQFGEEKTKKDGQFLYKKL